MPTSWTLRLPGSIGGTYGGNPVACAAGLAVFDIIAEEKLLDRANAIGDTMRKRFEALQKRFAVIGDVRGRGAMMGMELVQDPQTKEPYPALAKEVRAQLFERRVLSLLAGAGDNVVRSLVPLTIEDELLAKALDLIDESFEAAVAKLGAK